MCTNSRKAFVGKIWFMPVGSQPAAALANLISGTFILCTQNKLLGNKVFQETLVRQIHGLYQSDINF